jgi:hypothetical protein
MRKRAKGREGVCMGIKEWGEERLDHITSKHISPKYITVPRAVPNHPFSIR